MRSPKLQFAAARVVMASEALSFGEKIVWLEDRALDMGPEGAWIAPVPFEKRWGKSLTAATISEYRRRLTLYGLHEKIPRPGARSPGWVSTLPLSCQPRSSRPTDEEVEQLAVQLDAHVRARQGPNVGRAQTPTGVVLSVQQGLGSESNPRCVEGGRGEVPPSVSNRTESTLPPAVKGGERARARRQREEPLTAQERADFLAGVDRDLRERKLTPEQANMMRRMASGL